jgi:hypothetical protein
MSFPSFRAGIQGALVLTGLLTEIAVAVEPAPVPLIVPYEKTETLPLEGGVIDGQAEELTPPPNQQGNEPVPGEGSEWFAEPLPTEAGFGPNEADMSMLAPDDYGDLPEMGDAAPPESGDPQAFWSAPGLDRPFGESSLLPVISDGFEASISALHVPKTREKSGTKLEIGARTSVVYDSNVRRSATVTDGADKADWILSVAPAVAYGWKAGHWTGDVAARVSYDYYANNNGMGGLGYTLETGVRYDGGRWHAGANLGSSRTNGGNRYLGDYSEQIDYYSAINASYEISAKTLLDSSLSYRLAEPQSGNGMRTESLESIFAGLWKYSRLLELGPGFRYRWESNGATDDRVTVGPLLRTRYRLTGKTALDSDLGINFFESGDESDVAPFARLGVRYEMSRIWTFDFSLGNDSVADEAGGYRDTLQVRAGVSRPIRRANWRLGLGYEKINRDEAVLNVGDTTSFSVDTALMMKVFGERADAELFVLWREQQEDRGGSGDWSGTQVGLSLSAKF